MTRAWDEWAAAVFDVLAPRQVLLVLFVAATLISALWYLYPAWVPRRLPRLPRLRLPRLPGLALRRRRAARAAAPEGPLAVDVPPRPAPAGGLSAADLLAAQGRYAEAIRERLREVVGDLITAGVVAPQPGWTVTELAGAAASARPPVTRPLHDATALFSEVWYGPRPASAGHDRRMSELAGEVREALRSVGGAR